MRVWRPSLIMLLISCRSTPLYNACRLRGTKFNYTARVIENDESASLPIIKKCQPTTNAQHKIYLYLVPTYTTFIYTYLHPNLFVQQHTECNGLSDCIMLKFYVYPFLFVFFHNSHFYTYTIKTISMHWEILLSVYYVRSLTSV